MLILVSREVDGCTRAFVIADRGLQRILPRTGKTTIDLSRPPVGTLHYNCSMGMYGGSITFAAPPQGSSR
jgi:plastocyanin domain-containing protein